MIVVYVGYGFALFPAGDRWLLQWSEIGVFAYAILDDNSMCRNGLPRGPI
jgi:hypothetical protein